MRGFSRSTRPDLADVPSPLAGFPCPEAGASGTRGLAATAAGLELPRANGRGRFSGLQFALEALQEAVASPCCGCQILVLRFLALEGGATLAPQQVENPVKFGGVDKPATAFLRFTRNLACFQCSCDG